MAYTSVSLAQCQGSRTIRKWGFFFPFFPFHYEASDPFRGVYPPSVCQPVFSKGGSAGEVMGDGDNDASRSSVANAAVTVRHAINPSLHCTAPRKVEGQMGWTFISRFPNAGEIKTFFFFFLLH